MRKLLDWKAAIWSGVIAGAIFLMMEMAMVAVLQGESLWAPPRMMAAIVQGPSVLPPPATFDLGIVAVAMMVHFALSIALALVFAILHGVLNMNRATAIVAGIAFGFVVYIVNFYGMTALFPWFAMARNMVSIMGHALFGLVLGWTYHRLASGRARADRAATR